jgi:hypothetical protein
VAGPVEGIDRRLHRHLEPAGQLTAVTLFEEREIAVDPVQLLPHGRRRALPRPREVLVHLPGRQPPRGQPVLTGHLGDRLDELFQGRRREPGDIPRPLLLQKRVSEEAVLIAVTDLGLAAALQRHHVRQPRNSR